MMTGTAAANNSPLFSCHNPDETHLEVVLATSSGEAFRMMEPALSHASNGTLVEPSSSASSSASANSSLAHMQSYGSPAPALIRSWCLPRYEGPRCYGLTLFNDQDGHVDHRVFLDGVELPLVNAGSGAAPTVAPTQDNATGHHSNASMMMPSSSASAASSSGPFYAVDSTLTYPFFVEPVDASGGLLAGGGYQSSLTFIEIGAIAVAAENGTLPSLSSCIPSCRADRNESLYEFDLFEGNNAHGSLSTSPSLSSGYSWRVQDEPLGGSQGTEPLLPHFLVGCNETGGGIAACGGRPYEVRVVRSCLAPPPAGTCRRFLFGHSAVVQANTDPQGGRNGGGSLGQYNPQFKVSVDGTTVAEETDADAPFYSAALEGCPAAPCPPPESLLEVFQYQNEAVNLSWTLVDLRTNRTVMRTDYPSRTGQASSSSPYALQYTRRCIPRTGCYALAFSDDSAANSTSGGEGGWSNHSASSSDRRVPAISTQVTLDGVYLANTELQVPLWVAVPGGDGTCTALDMCGHDESLLRVTINTTSVPVCVSSDAATWTVFEETDLRNTPLGVASAAYFYNGYPEEGLFRHSMCVPSPRTETSGTNSSATSPSEASAPALWFGMLLSKRAPAELGWTVELDGLALPCRAVDSGVTHPFEHVGGDFFITPLNGSCPVFGGGTARSFPVSAGFIAAMVFALLLAVVGMGTAAWRCPDGGEGGESAGSRRARRGGGDNDEDASTACESDDCDDLA